VSDAQPSDELRRRIPLHTKIVVGLVLGIALGLAANEWMSKSTVEWIVLNVTRPAGSIFLRLMTMVVLPLVFSALSLAVVEIGDLRRLGKLGLKTLGFTAILSSTAVVLGIVLVDAIKPGHSLTDEKRAELQAHYAGEAAKSVEQATELKPVRDIVVDLFPQNPLQEMVGAIDGSSKGNGMLAVMVFALVFGAAITAAPHKCAALIGWLEGLNTVAMVVIGWAMRLAPLGAGCLVFSITARLGFDILVTLSWFIGTVVGGLAIHLVFTYSAVLTAFSRMSPWRFFRGAREAMLVAFGTSSSNATLPTAIKVAETDLGLPKEISRFVLTVGATGNQNGTALFEGVVVLFVAQVFGKDLTVAQQFQVVLMSILAGVGTAGVPGGSIPLIVVLMQSVGVPGEGIGIVLGVDRLADMCRTVVNVAGDLVVAACVAGGDQRGNL
jgi:DAACS family dicarboxylate/amino acid:cation (Na+ or H+) symporter